MSTRPGDQSPKGSVHFQFPLQPLESKDGSHRERRPSQLDRRDGVSQNRAGTHQSDPGRAFGSSETRSESAAAKNLAKQKKPARLAGFLFGGIELFNDSASTRLASKGSDRVGVVEVVGVN